MEILASPLNIHSLSAMKYLCRSAHTPAAVFSFPEKILNNAEFAAVWRFSNCNQPEELPLSGFYLKSHLA
jgi:hypothetical protein